LSVNYKSNNNVVYSCKYHIIWCPKYRRKVLVGDVEIRLKELIHEIAKELKVEIIEVETDKDHVHVLAEVDPQFGVNTFIRRVKGRTSRVLRDEFPHLRKRIPTLWTNSYFVSTVGGAPLEIVKQYIENQQLSESKSTKDKWKKYLKDGKR
jgi:putative transposase